MSAVDTVLAGLRCNIGLYLPHRLSRRPSCRAACSVARPSPQSGQGTMRGSSVCGTRSMLPEDGWVRERETGDVGENMQQLKQYSQQRNIQIHACTTQTWLTENMTDSELWMNSKNTFSYTALKHANTNVPSTVICMYITVSRAKRNVFCKHALTMERTGETASSALRRWDVF